MKISYWLRLSLGVCAAATMGCSNAKVPFIGRQPDIQIKTVKSIKQVTVNRIAVMPVIDAPGVDSAVADGAGEAVTAELFSQMSLAAGWQVVPQETVDSAMQQLPPANKENLRQNAQELGRLVSADAVMYGAVEKYKERVGIDYAAASPAAVTFSLYVLDMHSKQVVWSAKFDKTQMALTDNVFNLIYFLRNSARWVRANEIAQEGVHEAVNNLHDSVSVLSKVEHFETQTYEEQKTHTLMLDPTYQRPQEEYDMPNH